MGKSRFTEPQIMAVLRQAESGVAVPELCREHGISTASFYKWRSKYGGMDASMMSQSERRTSSVRENRERRLIEPFSAIGPRTMARENRRLKRMFADLSMQAEPLNCEGERHRFERT